MVEKIARRGRRRRSTDVRVAVWGLTFKANTDDLRDSPALVIVAGGCSRRARRCGPTTRPRARRAGAGCPGSRWSPTRTRPCDGAQRARGAHRVGRVPLARLRPGALDDGAAARSSTPATCSTRPRCAAAASPTRASAADGRERSSPAAPGSSARTSATLLLARGWEVVAVDNLLTGRRETSRTSPTTRVQLRRARRHRRRCPSTGRSTRCCTSPARRARPSTSRTRSRRSRSGSLGTRHTLDLARANGARFLLASTSEVYGDPLVHPQPETYWGNVNPSGPARVYDEAKRFAEAMTMAYHRELRRRRQDRAHLQHLRPAPAAGRRAGRLQLPRPGDATASRSRSTATASRPGRSATSTTRSRGILALLDSDHVGPDEHRQPGRVHDARARRARARGHRVAARRSCSSRCPPTTRRSAGPTSRSRGEVLGWEPQVDLREGLARTHDWYRRSAASTCRAVTTDAADGTASSR